jgi:zinc protease
MITSHIENNMLYYEHDPRTPVTKLTIVYVGAGEQKESAERIGLASITAKLLFKGTSRYTLDEFQTTCDLLGITISAYANETDFVIKLSFLSRNIEETISLVHHVIQDAGFTKEQLQLVKKQEQNRLESILQSDDEVLQMANKYFLFDKSFRGKVGSKASLEKISREDIVEYFKNVKTAKEMYFSVVSDLNEIEIRKSLDGIKDGRITTGFILGPEKEYRTGRGKEAFIVDSPNAPNDRLLWSHKGIDAANHRRFALSLILDALGSFEGFLFDQLRNKNGWCYGIYAYQFPPSNRKGLIGYYSDPSNSTSKLLIPKLLELMKSFRNHDDFLIRLDERSMTFKNRYAYQQDLNYKIASRINRDRNGIPILTKEEYFAEIDSVTRTTALQVITDIFNNSDLTMVFYGDARRISSILASTDPSISVEIHDKSELIA